MHASPTPNPGGISLGASGPRSYGLFPASLPHPPAWRVAARQGTYFTSATNATAEHPASPALVAQILKI